MAPKSAAQDPEAGRNVNGPSEKSGTPRVLDASRPAVNQGRQKNGADDGIRTRDLRFTKPLLYQLSYVGTENSGANMPPERTRATGMIRR
jgi:hypothetical protein